MQYQIINPNNNPKQHARLQKELELFKDQLKAISTKSKKLVHTLHQTADKNKIQKILSSLQTT